MLPGLKVLQKKLIFPARLPGSLIWGPEREKQPAASSREPRTENREPGSENREPSTPLPTLGLHVDFRPAPAATHTRAAMTAEISLLQDAVSDADESLLRLSGRERFEVQVLGRC